MVTNGDWNSFQVVDKRGFSHYSADMTFLARMKRQSDSGTLPDFHFFYNWLRERALTRRLIHFLTSILVHQLKRLELGQKETYLKITAKPVWSDNNGKITLFTQKMWIMPINQKCNDCDCFLMTELSCGKGYVNIHWQEFCCTQEA